MEKKISQETADWLIGFIHEMVTDNELFTDLYDMGKAISAAKELGASEVTLQDMQQMFDVFEADIEEEEDDYDDWDDNIPCEDREGASQDCDKPEHDPDFEGYPGHQYA